MATYTLGKIGMKLRGTYDASTPYNKLDVVTHNGSSYAALQSCTGVPVTNTECWQQLCVGNSENYSDDEVCTGGTWTDGKPIYRKVIHISSIGASSVVNYDLMPVSEIGDIVSIRGTACVNDAWGWIALPVSSISASATDLYATNIEIDCTEDIAKIKVATGTSRTISRGSIVVEYTKSV